MNTASASAPSGGITSWLRRAESWLDERGKFAWIAAMIAGFVFVWPLGLALLAYMIWSKRMFNRSSCAERRAARHAHHCGHHQHGAYRSSGNAAFDSYKTDMLRRLEDEQTAFESFLQRLRDAKDKSEFDSFMEDRARATREAAVTSPPAQDGPRAGEY